ncbi:MAG: glycosyltransferase family 2 protein [Chloroflexi bacterium]|nr:glycosyltransferase family 2 protein [Chloroflexota bacterium]
MTTPRVSIVVRCLNEEEHIGRLLTGIMEQTVKDVEIIVVDSGSTDATIAIASRFPIKLLHIRPEDFSFGRSLNIGCAAATGEFIVMASAHVYPVYQDWLESMLAPFVDPQVALVYGKQRGNSITKYSERQILAKLFPDVSDMRQDHPFCNNANSAIRTGLWRQIPYDESLTGLEDTAWAKRAMELGYYLAYSAEAEIIHVHNESADRVYNRYRREAVALKRIFPDEHFSLWDFVRLASGNIVSDFYHALSDGEDWRTLWSVALFRSTQFWGTYQGFAQRGPVTSSLKQTFYYPHSLNRPASGEAPARRALVAYQTPVQEPHSHTH